MENKDMIKAIAIILHYHKGGILPEEYEKVMGCKQPQWSEIPTWQQDEYLVQAEVVVEFLEKSGRLTKNE